MVASLMYYITLVVLKAVTFGSSLKFLKSSQVTT